MRTALAAYRARRVRNQGFGEEAAALFGEPSWDMLLDLYVSTGRGRRVSIKSSCVAADAPATTAQRHIQNLVRHGLIAREADCEDGRRSWLRLTPRGEDLMTRVMKDLAATNSDL